MERATADEAAAILAALPPLAFARPGAVASALVEHEGAWLDGAVVVGPPHEVLVRSLPQRDRTTLDTWIGLLERRHAQLVHDLSGPATGVLAAVETVLEYEPISESTRSLLEDARAGVLRLSQRLSARPRSALGPANVVVGPLASLVERAVERARRALDPQGTRLHVAVEVPPESVRIDVALLEEALVTLLANAWKARTGTRTHAYVTATCEEGLVLLSVRDEGRGLEPDALRRAGELGFSTWPGGPGLSLFLLRRALAMQGGALIVEACASGAHVSVVLRGR